MPDLTSLKPFSIDPLTKHLILCEGKDDETFLASYLRSDSFSQQNIDSIQVTQVHGVDNFRNTVRVLVNTDGFSRLRSILIIRDADNDIRSAQDNVKGVFANANLPVPQAECQWRDDGSIKTGFLLMPSCSERSQNGALDDLCWEIISNKYGVSIRNEVKDFIESLESSTKRTFTHKAKALIHTYFSATDRLIAASIGRAAEAGAFDWTSDKLQSLRDFLVSMV